MHISLSLAGRPLPPLAKHQAQPLFGAFGRWSDESDEFNINSPPMTWGGPERVVVSAGHFSTESYTTYPFNVIATPDQVQGFAKRLTSISYLKDMIGRAELKENPQHVEFNAKARYGGTVAHHIIDLCGTVRDPQKRLALLKLLKGTNAQLNAVSSGLFYPGGNLAHIIANSPSQNSLAELNFLKAAGVDMTLADENGNTPFHTALYKVDNIKTKDTFEIDDSWNRFEISDKTYQKSVQRVLNWFFQQKCVVNTPNKAGDSPAYLVALYAPHLLKKFYPQLSRYQARQIYGALNAVKHIEPGVDKPALLEGLVNLAKSSRGNSWRTRLLEGLSGGYAIKLEPVRPSWQYIPCFRSWDAIPFFDPPQLQQDMMEYIHAQKPVIPPPPTVSEEPFFDLEAALEAAE